MPSLPGLWNLPKVTPQEVTEDCLSTRMGHVQPGQVCRVRCHDTPLATPVPCSGASLQGPFGVVTWQSPSLCHPFCSWSCPASSCAQGRRARGMFLEGLPGCWDRQVAQGCLSGSWGHVLARSEPCGRSCRHPGLSRVLPRGRFKSQLPHL